MICSRCGNDMHPLGQAGDHLVWGCAACRNATRSPLDATERAWREIERRSRVMAEAQVRP